MLRLVGVALALGSFGSLVTCTIAWSRRRARQHGAMLADTARALSVPSAGLSRCLDASGATLERWVALGVPRAHQARVRRLAATARALRRHLPADQTRRLIELQCVAAASAAANKRWLRERLARRAVPSRRVATRRGSIVITSR